MFTSSLEHLVLGTLVFSWKQHWSCWHGCKLWSLVLSSRLTLTGWILSVALFLFHSGCFAGSKKLPGHGPCETPHGYSHNPLLMLYAHTLFTWNPSDVTAWIRVSVWRNKLFTQTEMCFIKHRYDSAAAAVWLSCGANESLLMCQRKPD